MDISRLWSIALLAFVLHDLGWILLRPALALPACLCGIVVLAIIFLAQFRSGSRFDKAVVCTALGWLVGNLFWNFAEFVWEEDEPAGFLGKIKFFIELNRNSQDLYGAFMWTATVVMMLSLTVFLIFCLVNYGRLSSSSTDDRRMVCGIMPEEFYLEVTLIPWIIMDSGWTLAVLLQVQIGNDAQDVQSLLLVSSIGGFVAILMEADCARRRCKAGDHSDALLYIGEMLWVLGNMIWMLEDVFTGHGEADYAPAYWTAVGLFVAAALIAIPAILQVSDEHDGSPGRIELCWMSRRS
eukprot:TRINITY_DN61551_c0_g1_i1.p1 TRINITY_DN61551_c0_g1~~TRINITY_DN61551_c0_g1_i1.p1  ORF type:complete len:296 (+),score=47.34 TRINITY_DN61551_c0_g1_i1:40-927(+)